MSQRKSFYKFWSLLRDEVPSRRGPFNLEVYLKHFTKEGAKIPFCDAKLAFEYSPWPAYSKTYHDNPNIYLDSFFNIFLTVSKSKRDNFYFPIALISFDIEEDRDTIVIWQIQGVRGATKFLKPVRWERMLVSIVVDWARMYNFKMVEIANVGELRFYPKRYNGGNMLLDRWEEELAKRMEFRYSVTAKRLGFKFNKTTKRWTKIF